MAALTDAEAMVLAALRELGVPEAELEDFTEFLAGLYAEHYRSKIDFQQATREGLAGAGLPAGLVNTVLACQAGMAGSVQQGAGAGTGAAYAATDIAAALRQVLREERRVGSVALSNLSATTWALIEQAARLTIKWHEIELLGDCEDVQDFKWDLTLREDQQADRYMPHLKQLFGSLYPDQSSSLLKAKLSWFEGGQKEKHFLTLTGLSDRFHFDKIAGNASAAIVEYASALGGDPQHGIHLLFELKKTNLNLAQARGELLLANLLNPDRRPVVVATDFADAWQLIWLSGHAVCHAVFATRAQAVHVIRQIISQVELAVGGSAGASTPIPGMPDTYFQRKQIPVELLRARPRDQRGVETDDVAELASLRGMIPEGELRDALARSFLQQAWRMPHFGPTPSLHQH